jgi:hypothetical protein
LAPPPVSWAGGFRPHASHPLIGREVPIFQKFPKRHLFFEFNFFNLLFKKIRANPIPLIGSVRPDSHRGPDGPDFPRGGGALGRGRREIAAQWSPIAPLSIYSQPSSSNPKPSLRNGLRRRPPLLRPHHGRHRTLRRPRCGHSINLSNIYTSLRRLSPRRQSPRRWLSSTPRDRLAGARLLPPRPGLAVAHPYSGPVALRPLLLVTGGGASTSNQKRGDPQELGGDAAARKQRRNRPS